MKTKMLKSVIKLKKSNISWCQCLTRLNKSQSFLVPSRCGSSDVAENFEQAVSTGTQGQDVERIILKRKKRLRNEPFVKNLFVGRFDKEMLVFPELDDKEEVEHLHHLASPVEKFFAEVVDSQQIDKDGKIPDDVIRQLGELGLFGQQVPHQYGGLELDATGYTRLAEVTALDGSIAVTLAGHQAIGLKGILIAGTEEQKQKYLPSLSTGEQIAAFCLTEPSSGSDAASIQTRATLSEDGQTYHLNGNKIWITNGGIADVFTVFAKTEITNDKGEKQDKMTAFIVERKFGGVTSGKPEDKLGIRGSNTCEVHFDNTPIPVENVLGQVGGGFKIAMNILNSGRFSMGGSGAGILKKLISITADHAIHRAQFKQKLMEFDLIKEKFAELAMTTYVMESMAYLTALNLDDYEQPDMSIEAAIVKVFSSEGCWRCASESLQVLGGLGYMKTYPCERYLRDARILMIFEGTNEILRLYIALECLKFAGKEMLGTTKKLKDVLNYPSLVFKALTAVFRSNKKPDSKKIKMFLNEEVHPSLKDEAVRLELAVQGLEAAVQFLLFKHGNKIKDKQLLLKRLSDVAIDLYAMTACLSRTSRSFSLALEHCDTERTITRLFFKEADARIHKNLEAIFDGEQRNGDDYRREIADKIFQQKGYTLPHPLTQH